MTHRSPPAILAAINYHQICLILLASIMCLTRDACAQPAVNTLGGMQLQATRQQNDIQRLLLNELLNNVNEDSLYNELKKYQRQQSNFLNKWPGLRDLLLMADYGDESDDSRDADIALNTANSHFIERLRQLAANTVDVPVEIPPYKKKPIYKDHGIKKNIQYMSPCHFKICNMGRKRNARFFEN